MKSLAAEGPEIVKNDVFLTLQAKNTVNYRDFTSSGVVWACVGGGSAAGQAAPTTFGYQPKASGKDTGFVAGARI